MANFYSKNTWCNIPNNFLSNQHIIKQKPRLTVDQIESLSKIKFNQKEKMGQLQDFFNFPKSQALNLFMAMSNSDDGNKIIQYFIDSNSKITGNRRLVTKAADQIAVIEKLHEIFPAAPKILIIRDGRDACISALKFKQLMKERRAPWLRDENIDYFKLLKVWSDRAKKAFQEWKANRLYLLRYVDLKLNFGGTVKNLFDHIDIDSSDKIIAEIQAATSFEKMSGGRKPGQEAKSLVRKGVVGEWKESLSKVDQEKAWKIAGDTLLRFNYSRK